MKGDFTRTTFRPEKHYSGVRMQQGRVQLDADWNEQLDIQAHLDRAARQDVLGICGGPEGNAGFALLQNFRLEPGKIRIGRGHYYVNGILCENETDLLLDEQPDLPDFRLPTEAGTYLAYLDVWQHHITALEDSDIREVSLGGPDTTTRTKTVWQVKLLKVGEPGPVIDCSTEFEAFKQITLGTTGKLSARAQPETGSTDPCIVVPGAGYRRLENQLYRVEVHTGGEPGTATFKWSRDNGALSFAIEELVAGDQIRVRHLGLDQVLGLRKGDWVEVLDDGAELGGRPGLLAEIADIDPAQRIVSLSQAVSVDLGRHPKLRRWDSVAETKIELPATNEGWIALEDGVEVRFEAGNYRSGDYWLIPARTVTGDIEWAQAVMPDGTRQPRPQTPHGIVHHYCRLWLLAFDANQHATLLSDCRQHFPSLTGLASLCYVGGDGQEGTFGATLPQPLEVGVANGPLPVVGARVKFAILGGNGERLRNPVTQEEGLTLFVTTDATGIASCLWTLDSRAIPVQRVEATLVSAPGLEVLDDPFSKQPRRLPIHFTAFAKESGSAAAIHVTSLSVKDANLQDVPLSNDSDIATEALARGLKIVCDRAIHPATISRATCFVTLEVPFPLTTDDRAFWGNSLGLVGYQPITLESSVTVTTSVINWSPAPSNLLPWLDKLFQVLNTRGFPERVLARLTLKGNFILDTGNPALTLDGDSFGSLQVSGQITKTEVSLPSGDGRRGGDFEMWFGLLPPELKSVAVSPTQGSVGTLATITVTLNRPAPAGGTQVNLTSTHNNLLKNLPTTISIPVGQPSGTFQVQIQAISQNVTATITASSGGFNRTTTFLVINNL